MILSASRRDARRTRAPSPRSAVHDLLQEIPSLLRVLVETTPNTSSDSWQARTPLRLWHPCRGAPCFYRSSGGLRFAATPGYFLPSLQDASSPSAYQALHFSQPRE